MKAHVNSQAFSTFSVLRRMLAGVERVYKLVLELHAPGATLTVATAEALRLRELGEVRAAASRRVAGGGDGSDDDEDAGEQAQRQQQHQQQHQQHQHQQHQHQHQQHQQQQQQQQQQHLHLPELALLAGIKRART